MVHGPRCSAACRIFPDQGSNPCPLHWQVDSSPLRHQGSPVVFIINNNAVTQCLLCGRHYTWGIYISFYLPTYLTCNSNKSSVRVELRMSSFQMSSQMKKLRCRSLRKLPNSGGVKPGLQSQSCLMPKPALL